MEHVDGDEAKVLGDAERADEALDLLLDLTAAPAFSAADVDIERDVILEEMAEAKDALVRIDPHSWFSRRKFAKVGRIPQA